MAARVKPIQTNTIELKVSSLYEPEDMLVPFKILGSEGISSLFSYEMECISHNDNLDLSKLLHNSAQCKIKSGPDIREINGYITYAKKVGTRATYSTLYSVYAIRVESWMCLLANNIRSRNFLNKNLKAIIETIFENYPFASFNMHGIKNEHHFDYLVQYNESDLHFVQRILQNKGVSFYFEHENRIANLLLGDDTSFYKNFNLKTPINALLDTNKPEYIAPTQINETHYDFDSHRPILNTVQSIRSPKNQHYTLEYHLNTQLFDETSSERAKQMQERVISAENIFHGIATQPILVPGKIIYKKNRSRCLITKINLDLEDSTILNSNYYKGHLTCKLDFQYLSGGNKYYSDKIFVTPKVFGTQNAVVVGPKEGKVYSDKFGRVKVNIILGSVYNSRQKPFLNAENANTMHGIQSAQGHAILLDDKEGNEKVSMVSKKDFELTSAENAKLTQKTFELSSDESIQLVAGKGGVRATVQMSPDGGMIFKVGPRSTFTMNSAGQVIFDGTTEVKMMGNLEVTGNILATGEVHGTNI